MTGSGNERVALHVVVRGQVQGVWYRESMRRQAEQLGVDGWVENRPDGTVAATVEGPRHAVELLVDWCRQGPPAARVESVQTTAQNPSGQEGFRVRR